MKSILSLKTASCLALCGAFCLFGDVWADEPSSAEYQILDYIESNGFQHFDTGVAGNTVYGLELGMSVTGMKGSEQVYIGSGVKNFEITSKATGETWIRGCAREAQLYAGNTIVFDNTTCNHVAMTNGVFSVGPVVLPTAVPQGQPLSSAASRVFIGSGAAKTMHSFMRVYWAKLFGLDGAALRDYVPVLRKADGAVGLYDRVGSTFSAGGGFYIPAPVAGKVIVAAASGTASVDGGAASAWSEREIAGSGTLALTASGEAGCAFLGWFGPSGLVSKSLSIEVPADAAAVYVARFAKWTYTADPAQLRQTYGSTDNWVFDVTASGTSLTLKTLVKGCGDCDFSTAEADTGMKVSGLTSALFNGNLALTSFVDSDVAIVPSSSVFQSCAYLTNVVLSPALSELNYRSFNGCLRLRAFSPTTMPNLTKMAWAFNQNAGTDESVTEGLDFDFSGLTVLKGTQAADFSQFNGSGLIRSLTAHELTSIKYTSGDAETYAFSQCPRLESVDCPKLAVIGNGTFKSNPLLASAILPDLAYVGVNAFKDDAALASAISFGEIAEIPSGAFAGCAAVPSFTFRGLGAVTLRTGAFTGISFDAKFVFFGAPPVVEAGAITVAEGDAAVRFSTVRGAADPAWAAAVAPNADVFASWRGRADDPGSKAFGLIALGNGAYAWAVNADYALRITAEPAEYGTPDPGYGMQFGIAGGTVLSGSAPDAEFAVSETQKAKFAGWKRYTVADDGTETLQDEAETNQYAFVSAEGEQTLLRWQIKCRNLIAIDVGPGGSVDLADPWVEDGTVLTVTATPDEKYSFAGWTGTLPEGAVTDGNTITFTVSGSESFGCAFSRGWEFADDVLSDGVNWSFPATVISETDKTLSIGKRSSGAGDCDLSKVEAETGYRVVKIANSCFQQVSGLTSFYGPDVTDLGQWAFSECTSLTNVRFSADLAVIGQRAFDRCYKLRGFYPTTLPRVTTVGGFAFSSCGTDASCAPGLDFDFPALGDFTSGSSSAYDHTTFSSFGLLRSLRATNVTYITYGDTDGNATFCNGCTRLVSVELPRIVKLGGSTFTDCTSLTNVVFGKSVETICTNAFTQLPDAAVFRFGGSAPDLQPGSITSKSGKPVALCFDCSSRCRASWQTLAEPNDALFRSEYVGRADFPGTANGYDTIGIVDTGAIGTPVYNWLIDTRKHYGLSVIIR